MQLADHPVAVVLFTLRGCAACAAAKPVFERVREHYAKCLPGFNLDASMNVPLAEIYGVKTVPTIFVIRKGKRVSRLVNAVSQKAIEDVFIKAAKGLECKL